MLFLSRDEIGFRPQDEARNLRCDLDIHSRRGTVAQFEDQVRARRHSQALFDADPLDRIIGLAHPGRVGQRDLVAIDVEDDIDRIARRSGELRHDGNVLAR